MKNLNTIMAIACVAGTISGVAPAFAADEYNTSIGTTVAGQGVALRGNDSVALFTGLDVTPGQAKFTAVHDNVAYYFSSEETMKQFAADPEAFVPQYGGFCAFGVAKGLKLDANPRFADVVDGKLYLFLNADVFEAYKKDKARTIAKAEANWPDMEHRTVEDVNGL
jgi:YHS domain-containing protein